MAIHHFTTLLEFYLKNTYFLFQYRYFDQAHDPTTGSPISLNEMTELYVYAPVTEQMLWN